MDMGGASLHDALPSFDPAFSLRKKSTGYCPIFFPPVLPLSSPSRPGFAYHFEFMYQFRILKKWHNASVWVRGPGRNAPEASVGLPLVSEDESLFPPKEAGSIFPAPFTEK